MTYDPDAREHRPGENQPDRDACPECWHTDPHTFAAGCPAQVIASGDATMTRRCGCLARNDDPPVEGTVLDQDDTPVPTATGRGYPTTDRRRVR